MLISIVGAGYVGLVTAACLAKLGNAVRVIDSNKKRISILAQGQTPIHEPGLLELMSEGVAEGRLSFDSDLTVASGTQFMIVAVGTLDDGEWTAAFVRDTAMTIAQRSELPRQIVVRSTLLPGTMTLLAKDLAEIDGRVELGVNPEFTREGSAIADFMSPDRVVIGVADPAVDSGLRDALVELYQRLDAPLVVTDWTSAEAIKVGSNVFLAVKITFANELARLCAAAGADVKAVVDGLGLDRRIGRAFLSPSPGYGGSCLPSQARALPALAQSLGASTPLIASIDESNQAQARWYVDLAGAALGGSLLGKEVAILGATFKARTDDVRESAALRIARLLGERGTLLRIYDPMATEAAVRQLADGGTVAKGCESVLDASDGVDALVIATEWPEFGAIDWSGVRQRMRGSLVVDTRNIIDIEAAHGAGLTIAPAYNAASHSSAGRPDPL